MRRDRTLQGLVVGLVGCQANLTPLPGESLEPPLDCVPDLDGAIAARELPVGLGIPVTYYVSGSRTVELGLDAAGAWDLSEESADDDLVEVAATALAGHWYASDFAGGQFVADATDDLEAVYHRDEVALWLHGLASRDPDPAAGRTLLVYDAPVPVLRLPLAVGDGWTAVGQISEGTLNGLAYVGTDTYQVAVVAEGRLELPYVRFAPALQVRTHLVVEPAAGGVTTSRRQASFLFECFGEVARAESRLDEPDPEFNLAASLRRFAL